ncbi:MULTISPECIES: DUF6083 domain-containing protein [unclassified Streptomyces]|uniref:DUF6083 domain-containing protein n=1 Tax=unclassified Streptomyces TaxID=2593676 RepID=UPI00068A624A|nr:MULTISPECIES: DUF6083 domain-containing protein [unclassified Streptomyces]
MRPHTPHGGRHWDGSPRHLPYRRTLRIARDSPSRLLRAGQTGRCRHCGNRIDRYECFDGRLIDLHPAEVITSDISETCRWHVSSGIAYPHDDGSGWCRLPHAVLCPRWPPHCQTDTPKLVSLRRELGIRTRRLIDNGAFTPEANTPNTEAPEGGSGQEAQP